MYCWHCGKRISQESKFCTFCGSLVDKGVEKDPKTNDIPTESDDFSRVFVHPVEPIANPLNANEDPATKEDMGGDFINPPKTWTGPSRKYVDKTKEEEPDTVGTSQTADFSRDFLTPKRPMKQAFNPEGAPSTSESQGEEVSSKAKLTEDAPDVFEYASMSENLRGDSANDSIPQEEATTEKKDFKRNKWVILTAAMIVLVIIGSGSRAVNEAKSREAILSSDTKYYSTLVYSYNKHEAKYGEDKELLDYVKDTLRTVILTAKPSEYNDALIAESDYRGKFGNDWTLRNHVDSLERAAKGHTTTASPTKNVTTPSKLSPKATSPRLSSSEVYYWIQDRFDHYDRVYNNGQYSGDKYESQVFRDAAAHFGVSVSAVREAYNSFRY